MLRNTVRGRLGMPQRVGRYRDLFGLARQWNVVRFLACGGTVLVVLGVTGAFGWLGSLSRAELFHPPNWINWLHLGFGGFVWAVVLLGGKRLQRGLALFGALAGVTLGLADLVLRGYGTLGEGKAQAADLSDPLTHLTVGLLAIGALLNNRRDCYEKPEHPPAHS